MHLRLAEGRLDPMPNQPVERSANPAERSIDATDAIVGAPAAEGPGRQDPVRQLVSMEERAESMAIEAFERRKRLVRGSTGKKRAARVEKKRAQVAKCAIRVFGEAFQQRCKVPSGQTRGVGGFGHSRNLRKEKGRTGRVPEETSDQVNVECARDGLAEEHGVHRRPRSRLLRERAGSEMMPSRMRDDISFDAAVDEDVPSAVCGPKGQVQEERTIGSRSRKKPERVLCPSEDFLEVRIECNVTE